MKTTTRGRGPNGQFVRLDTRGLKLGPGHTSRFYATLFVAGAAAILMALFLARCHVVWSHDNWASARTLPQDLQLNFD